MMYLKNRSLTKLLKKITPYKSNTGNKLNLNNLYRFICVAYYHNKILKILKLVIKVSNMCCLMIKAIISQNYWILQRIQ